MLEQLKKEVLAANLFLRDTGLVCLTWGNASGIDRERGLVVIKPSGVEYDTMRAEDMVVLDLDGNVVEGELNPSSDAPTHLELYRRFPEIGGVVHTHSIYATAFAQARKPIPALGTTHADHFWGDIPCTPDMTEEEIGGEYELNTGKVIVRTFADLDPMKIPAVLVASHGVFTWGSSAKGAAENALVTEKTAEMAYLSLTVAPEQRIAQALLDRHFFRKHGANAYYGQSKKSSGTKMDFTELLSERLCDACGKVHGSEVKKIVMGEGVLPQLPDVIREMGDYRHAVLVCDENTYKAAGERVERLWQFDRVIVLDPTNLHANEHGVAMVEERLPERMDLLVAVGSGTIHDITRYNAYLQGVPFVSVPTAASVDGYVSNVAAMTWNGAKKTLTACAPIAMVADIDIIAEAPDRLTASGVGDMLGKYTALLDWNVGRILTGEYYCAHVVSLMKQALDSVIAGLDRLRDGDRDAMTSLMYGLVLSGIAMQHTGISRPASGAEHHISHFIEMTIPAERCDALHGEKVGVGLVLVSRLYHAFCSLSDEEIESGMGDYPVLSDAFVRENFGSLAPEIMKENEKNCAAGITKEQFLAALPELRALIAELPTPEQLKKMLAKCDACQTLEDIGLSEADMLPELYRLAPLVRNRLTLMRLLTALELN